jgi:hypothetical protein
MKQSSKRLVSLALAFFFIIASLVLLFDLIQPGYAALTDTKSQVAGEQAFLADETKAVAQAQTLLTTYNNQGQGGQNVALAMPPTEDQAGALAQIYGIAQNSGLTIGTVGVSAPTIQAKAPIVIGTAPTPQQLTKPVGAVSFQITATGSYESLKSFLEQIETNVRLFDLKSITLAGGLATAKDSFSVTMTLTSYYQTQ